jgi:site-specific DNA recombinase
MQGMIAESERAQMLERTRRGRLEQARRGELIPWAYRCYGSRYLPKRHGCSPQVRIEPGEAGVVRRIYRLLVEEPLSGRQITKRLNESHTPTPSGRHQVWHPATVRALLTNRIYAGQARSNDRQPVVPSYRKTDAAPFPSLKTGRRYRPHTEWVWSDAPAIISREVVEKAQMPWQHHAALAHKMSQPASRRDLLRRLVQGGDCGLAMTCNRHQRVCYNGDVDTHPYRKCWRVPTSARTYQKSHEFCLT